MSKIFLSEADDTVVLSHENETRSFRVYSDLEKAKEWFRILLQAPTPKYPLYDSALLSEVSLWTTQTFRIGEDLKYVVRFEEVLRYISEHPDCTLEVRGEISAPFQALLAYMGLLPTENGFKKRAKRRLIHAFAKLNTELWFAVAKTMKRPVLVYTPENPSQGHHSDFRFRKGFQWLEDHGISYYECLHTCWRWMVIKSRILHKKLIWSFESDFEMQPLPQTTPNTELPPEMDVLKYYWSRMAPHYWRMIESNRLHIEKIGKRLRAIGTRHLVGMEDFRSIPPLLLACAQEKIPSTLIMHGGISRYHIGWVNPGIPEKRLLPVGKFLTHSPLWKKIMGADAPNLDRNIEIVRDWVNPSQLRRQSALHSSRPAKGWTVCFLYETTLPSFYESKQYAKKLIREGVNILFKVRPDIDTARQISAYFDEAERDRVTILTEVTQKTLEQIDFIVGHHSSLVFQLLNSGVPAIAIQTSYRFGIDLTEHDLAQAWNANEAFELAAMAATRNFSRRQEIIQKEWVTPKDVRSYSDVLKERLREFISVSEAPKVLEVNTAGA